MEKRISHTTTITKATTARKKDDKSNDKLLTSVFLFILFNLNNNENK